MSLTLTWGFVAVRLETIRPNRTEPWDCSAQVMAAGYVCGVAVWTGLFQRLGHEAVWSIIAAGFSFGAWIIYFGKDYDPRESLT